MAGPPGTVLVTVVYCCCCCCWMLAHWGRWLRHECAPGDASCPCRGRPVDVCPFTSSASDDFTPVSVARSGRAAGEACGLAQGHVTESAGRPPLGVTGFCPPPSPTSSRHRIYICAMVVRLRFLTDVSDVCECVVHF